MNISQRHSLLALTATLWGAMALANQADEGEADIQRAHEHGLASLNIAVEDKRLEMEFDSPAINLLGFERAPASPEEQQKMQEMSVKLRNVAQLFVLPAAAGCRAGQTKLSTPQFRYGREHGDYKAQYKFLCQNMVALDTVEVMLVNILAEGTKLRVQVASTTGQSAKELEPGETRIRLR